MSWRRGRRGERVSIYCRLGKHNKRSRSIFKKRQVLYHKYSIRCVRDDCNGTAVRILSPRDLKLSFVQPSSCLAHYLTDESRTLETTVAR